MATATANRLGRFGTTRHLRGGVAALLGLALLIKIGGLAIGEHAVRESKPALIAATAPLFPAAGARAADAALAGRDVAAAERLARRTLQESPLSTRALRNLGLAREAQGDIEGAAAAISLAGGLGWRDVPAQLWLLRAYAAQGDYAAALERGDALARMREHVPEMLTLFMVSAIDPAGRAALAHRLAANPPWRTEFFKAARELPAEVIPPYTAFLESFAASGHSLDPGEVEPIVGNLFSRGDHAKARALWVRLAAPAAAGDNLLFDGGFEAASLDGGRRAPFEWQFRQAPGSETALRPHPVTGGKALFVASPGNARFEMAQQSLALAPGRYVFSVEASADVGARLEGFSWMLECLPGNHDLRLAESAGEGSARRSYAFTVPPSGCGAQRLRLILHGLQPRPLALWFDEAVVTRAD